MLEQHEAIERIALQVAKDSYNPPTFDQSPGERRDRCPPALPIRIGVAGMTKQEPEPYDWPKFQVSVPRGHFICGVTCGCEKRCAVDEMRLKELGGQAAAEAPERTDYD